MTGMRMHKIVGWCFCLAVFAFLLLPLVVVISSAFGTAEHVTFPPQGFTLRWFREALHNKEFLGSLWITLKLCLVSVSLYGAWSYGKFVLLERTAKSKGCL